MKSISLGYIATSLYCVALVVAMALLSFEVVLPEKSEATLFVEFVEPLPEPELPPATTTESVDEAPQHDVPAPVEQEAAAEGTKEPVQTINPRALFNANRGGADEPVNAGNNKAAESDKDSSQGVGSGRNSVGSDQLDAGLQGRGLAGTLPAPIYPSGNKQGKVVVDVVVAADGSVTSATYQPRGSTTSDSSLVEAAVVAARKARFVPSKTYAQTGTITYSFVLRTNN